MKKLILVLMFLISCSLVSAGVDVAYGYITLTKMNIEPEVEVSLSSELFAGQEVFCETQVFDENPESVELEIEWFVNNQKVHEGVSFSDFRKGDFVECIATPTDAFGLRGTAKGIAMNAKAAPFSLTGFFSALF